jgi:hypothetical protein
MWGNWPSKSGLIMALNYTVSLQPLEQQAFGILECRNSDQEGQEPFSHLGEVTLDTMEAATSEWLPDLADLQ